MLARDRRAYTIGNRDAYDQALAGQENPWKLGRHPADPQRPDYPGGSVWRTPDEVAAFIGEHGANFSFPVAIYELQLLTSWELDVSPDPNPVGLGWHDLLHDARIVRRVDIDAAEIGGAQ